MYKATVATIFTSEQPCTTNALSILPSGSNFPGFSDVIHKKTNCSVTNSVTVKLLPSFKSFVLESSVSYLCRLLLYHSFAKETKNSYVG